MTVRTTIRSIHRYLSLTVAAFWILQALTGALSVWHRELDAALLDAPDTPLNVTALGESIESLAAARSDSHFSSLYAVGGVPNQFDLHTGEFLGLTGRLIWFVTGRGSL